MKRALGFTLIELVVATASMAAVGGTFLTVAQTIHQEERLAAACAGDIQDLSRALRALESAAREARTPDEVGARLVGTELHLRGARVLRNVASFSLAWEERATTMRVVLGPRSDAPHRREAAVELVVVRRPKEEAR